MGKLSNCVGIKEITAGLLQHVAEADLDMQIYQAYTWKEATLNIPFLNSVDKEDVGGADSSEGIDRLNNLGVSSAELCFLLEEIKPNWLIRSWHKITNTKKAKQFCIVNGNDRKITNAFQMKICVKRKPTGLLKTEAKVEKVSEEMLNAKLPDIFS